MNCSWGVLCWENSNHYLALSDAFCDNDPFINIEMKLKLNYLKDLMAKDSSRLSDEDKIQLLLFREIEKLYLFLNYCPIFSDFLELLKQ